MTGFSRATAAKLTVFATVMVLLTISLFLVFGDHRVGSTTPYSAEFVNVSRLKAGDTVRAAGIRVGTVSSVRLGADNVARVDFDADRSVPVTTGTTATVKYLNLVGDRYLELAEAPGAHERLGAGGLIPTERTVSALDLDQLLGGLKPVLQGLDPADVNALTSSLLLVLQDQGGTIESLMSSTSSFTTTLARNGEVITDLIDRMNEVVQTLADDGGQLSAAIDRFEQLATGLAGDRDVIGEAITSLSAGTASLSDLLVAARPPLSATVDELNRLAPLLNDGKVRIDAALQKAPENYRKLIRVGSYGAFLNYYICGLQLRVTDLQGRTALFPWIKQENGRCEEP